MGFHMNETTDMPKNAESGNWEISDEAMRKFDKLMGDDDLPENPADFKDFNCLLEDPQTEYYTSYEERLKCTPTENCDYGRWEGGRGSRFYPIQQKKRNMRWKVMINGEFLIKMGLRTLVKFQRKLWISIV